MKCPNYRSQEFKDLVQRVGETQAYLMYIKNDFEIPGEDVKFDDKLYEEVDQKVYKKVKEANDLKEKLLQNLSLKFQLLEKKQNEASSKESKDSIEKIKNKIKEQIELITDENQKQGLLNFVSHAGKTIKIYNKILNNKNSISDLRRIENYIGSYEILNEVDSYLRKNTEYKDKEIIESALNALRDFKEDYNDTVEEILINKLSGYSNVIKAKYRDQFERDYKRENPKESNQDQDSYNQIMKEVVDEQLNQMKNQIESEEKDYIRETLLMSPKDIGKISSLLVDAKGINDHLIQLTTRILDEADFKTKEKFIRDRKRYYDKFSKILPKIAEADKGKTNGFTQSNFSKKNMEKLYGDILERDSKGRITGFITEEIRSDYWSLYSKMLSEKELAESEKEKQEIENNFRKTHLKNFKKSLVEASNINENWHNPQWKELNKDLNRKELYDLLVSLQDESNDLVPKSHSLKKGGRKIPSITSSFSENVEQNGLAYALKRSAKDSLFIQSDDYMYGDLSEDEKRKKMTVFANEKGQRIDSIALPFRNELSDKNDLSLDLFGSFMTNHFVSINFKQKEFIKEDLLTVQQILEERGKFIDSTDGKSHVQKIKDVFGVTNSEEREIYKEMKGSNKLKLYESLLQDRLLGITRVYGGTLPFGVSVDKATDSLMKISARNFLSWNYLGGAANALQGNVMNLMEGVKGKHYTEKDLLKGEKIYMKDIGAVLKDIGEYVPKSKTNLLLEKFMDTAMDFSGFANDILANKKVRRMLGESYSNSANASAEHFVQSTLMYAYLNSIKMQNKKGEFVNKEGKVVERKDAMTLNDAYTVNDGKLIFDKKLVPEGMSGNKQIQIEQRISSKMKDIVADLHGNHDPKNQAMIQRYWYGRLAMFMRKWIVRTALKRYRGIGTSLKDLEDLTMDERYYSVAKDSFEEGTYTSFTRFMASQIKKGKEISVKAAVTDFNTLSDEEKGNIRMAVTEMAIVALAFSSSFLLQQLAESVDEEDEKLEGFIYNFAYLSERLKGEMLFYVPGPNIPESLRILGSPTATMTTMSAIYDVLEQMIPWNLSEEYTTGKRKEKNKLLVKTRRLFDPFYKNAWDSSAKDKFNYLKNAK